MGAPANSGIDEKQAQGRRAPRSENSNSTGRARRRISPPRTESTGPIANGNFAVSIPICTGSQILTSNRPLLNPTADLKKQAAAVGRSARVSRGRFVNPSSVNFRQSVPPTRNIRSEVAAIAVSDEPFVVGRGDEDNPFANHNATDVTVTAQVSMVGKSNHCVVSILRNQGYSDEQIWAPDEDGVHLVDHVAQANELSDDYLVRPGDELVVPTTLAPTEEATSTTLR